MWNMKETAAGSEVAQLLTWLHAGLHLNVGIQLLLGVIIGIVLQDLVLDGGDGVLAEARAHREVVVGPGHVHEHVQVLSQEGVSATLAAEVVVCFDAAEDVTERLDICTLLFVSTHFEVRLFRDRNTRRVGLVVSRKLLVMMLGSRMVWLIFRRIFHFKADVVGICGAVIFTVAIGIDV